MRGGFIVLFSIFVQTSRARGDNYTFPDGSFNTSRFIKFPGANGTLHDVDLKASPDRGLLLDIIRDMDSNKYFLYTRNNPVFPDQLIMNKESTVLRSNFNPVRQTVVFVNGWQAMGFIDPLHMPYLQLSDVNFISLDWSRLSLADYPTSVSGVPAVGRHLGHFLRWMALTFGLRYQDVHLVGFSLGAHVVGCAGRVTLGQIARITGLDPAGPLWNLNIHRLRSSDAVYVEVIHTNAGVFGIAKIMGHADFFPNGGSSQPGCLTDVCNHLRAIDVFAATLRADCFVGKRCQDMTQVVLGTCSGGDLRMGGVELKKFGASGCYSLQSKPTFLYPFFTCTSV